MACDRFGPFQVGSATQFLNHSPNDGGLFYRGFGKRFQLALLPVGESRPLDGLAVARLQLLEQGGTVAADQLFGVLDVNCGDRCITSVQEQRFPSAYDFGTIRVMLAQQIDDFLSGFRGE